MDRPQAASTGGASLRNWAWNAFHSTRPAPRFSPGAASSSAYEGDLPKLSILAQLELLWASKRLEKFAREIPAQRPWEAPRARDWDSITLETWKRRNMRSAGARLFLDIVTCAVFTSEPRDLSFLFFLNYLRSGQGLESLISIRGERRSRSASSAAHSKSRKSSPIHSAIASF